MTSAPEGAPAPSVQQEVSGSGNVFTGTGDVYVVRNEVVPTPDRPALRNLREKVRQFWVQGVLESSLHGRALLALGKEAMPEAVEHPWARVLELPDGTSRTIDPVAPALQLYEDASRMLLLLGEPGSSKTTTLLELARDLIREAEHDESRPVPVVLNLATWGQAETKLMDWVASELSGKYRAPRKLAKGWLEHGGLVLLLDGLDEVAEGRRSACVSAINEYLSDVGVPGLCLCSRLQEYVSLGTKIRLSGAVRLEALRDAQVAEYIEAAGEKLAGLGEALRGDAGLREVTRSPLMLSVMSLAYEGVPTVEVVAPELTTAQAWRARGFRAYVGKMFGRRGQAVQRYAVQETVQWLHHLAKGMKARSQTVFLIEDLQPDWLPGWALRAAYAVVSRVMAGTVYAIWLLRIPGTDMLLLIFGSFAGAYVGMVDAVRFVLGPIPDATVPSEPRRAWRIIYGFCTLFGCWFLTRNHAMSFGTLMAGLVLFGGALGIIFGWRSDPRGLKRDIRTTTRQWSWKGVRRGAAWGFLVAFPFVCTIFIFHIPGYLHSHNLRTPLLAFVPLMLLALQLSVGSVFGIVGAILGGISERTIEITNRPNEGIVRSLKNAVVASLIGAVPLVAASWGDGSHEPQATLAMLSPPVASLLFLGYGGIDVIQHCVLRLMLAAKGRAPLRFARFLDHCVSLAFLQKVGGGYVFVHRLLLEHFAESPDDRGA